LSFDPSTVLHQRPNTYSIKPLMRLVDEPKSYAISAQFISFEVLTLTGSISNNLSSEVYFSYPVKKRLYKII